MIGMRGLMILAVVIGLIGYQFLTLMPPGLADKFLLGHYNFLMGTSVGVGFVGGKLGFGDELELANKVLLYQASFFADSHDGLEVIEADFDGVPVVIYRPLSAEGTLPAVIYFHGGGFALMGPVTHDSLTSALARNTPALVVSVDYRLAAKHPYPAGLNDCYTATKYLMKHAQEFKVDPKRIAVAGDSAGGNLAATVSMKFRDMRERTQPKLQIIIAPVLQLFNFKLPSYLQKDYFPLSVRKEQVPSVFYWLQGTGSSFLLPQEAKLIGNNSHTSRDMKVAFQDIFDVSLIPEVLRQGYVQETPDYGDEDLADKYVSFILDPYICPLMADSLANLPEAFIMTCEYDILRDDGILYAKHLERAGVPVTWYNAPDAFHGHLVYLTPPLAGESSLRDVKKVVSFLKEKL